ncbi:MAG: hypothetical protein SFY68_01195 [Candidatus Sumerlaeia bacterium]|nr:hypothetical protein [Candidatus Sumerlaeia bacterium]
MNRTFLLVASSGLLLATVTVPMSVDPNSYAAGRSRDEQARVERNSSSVAQLFGELRASMSDIVFLKTERYLHGGIAYSAHMNVARTVQEETSEYDAHEKEARGVAGDEHEEEDDHSGTPTLIPTAEDDFRGVIGHLERQIRPWQDPSIPHQHSTGTELLPWYRVMTLSDPHNIRGYLIGAYWLSNLGKFEEARQFITEGIGHNPEAFQLYLYRARGILKEINYIEHENPAEAFDQSPNAALHQMMLDDLKKSSELVLQQRPQIYDINPEKEDWNWTHYMEDDAGAALRMTVSVLKREGEYKEALEWARVGAPRMAFIDLEGILYPEDPKLREYISELEQLVEE